MRLGAPFRITGWRAGRPALVSILLQLILLTGACLATAADDTGPAAEKNVGKAIAVRQTSQKDLDRWEVEKAKLIVAYETLARQKEALEQAHEDLSRTLTALEQDNRELALQKRESVRIRTEMIPLLEKVYNRLSTVVASDPPFLKEEREVRLVRLDKVLKDPGITFSEKYRKVMEALFIEAEYGSTIEVYQDKIVLGDGPSEGILGNIFRLGRVSLFFLSLDNTVCGVFNPGESRWESLPDHMLPAIRSAVEIGSKRRPVELLPLPLGRLVVKGGVQ